MTTTQHTFVPSLVEPDFDSFAVRQAIAGFLAGYGDATRAAYSLDLRQWLGWCASHDLRVFEVKRAHIELFARSLEHDGKARATVARRLSTIAGFYRYCVEEQLIPVSPRCMSAVRGWTTNRTPPDWIATNSACSWSKQDSPEAATTH